MKKVPTIYTRGWDGGRAPQPRGRGTGHEMTRLWAELRAFAQAAIEICAPTISVRWWPPSVHIDQAGADERVAAVRAGGRRVGIRD